MEPSDIGGGGRGSSSAFNPDSVALKTFLTFCRRGQAFATSSQANPTAYLASYSGEAAKPQDVCPATKRKSTRFSELAAAGLDSRLAQLLSNSTSAFNGATTARNG